MKVLKRRGDGKNDGCSLGVRREEGEEKGWTNTWWIVAAGVDVTCFYHGSLVWKVGERREENDVEVKK